MPHFLAMSRIVVRPKPIFWKSCSETFRIFFLVASFLVSRRPMSLSFRGPRSQVPEKRKQARGKPHQGAQIEVAPGAVDTRGESPLRGDDEGEGQHADQAGQQRDENPPPSRLEKDADPAGGFSAA